MAIGVKLFNAHTGPIYLRGVWLKPGVATFVTSDILQDAQTQFYIKKGLLRKDAPTRVKAASKAKVVKKPAAKPPKVEAPKEPQEAEVPVTVEEQAPEPEPVKAHPRKKRRSKKAPANPSES